MLDDLGNRVDNTDSKLRRTSKKLNDFIRKNESELSRPQRAWTRGGEADDPATRSNWCIGILIVVLIILLVLVILS